MHFQSIAVEVMSRHGKTRATRQMKALTLFSFFYFIFFNKSKLSGFSPLWLSLLGSASTELCPGCISPRSCLCWEKTKSTAPRSQDYPSNNKLTVHPMPLPLQSQPSLLPSTKALSPVQGVGRSEYLLLSQDSRAWCGASKSAHHAFLQNDPSLSRSVVEQSH